MFAKYSRPSTNKDLKKHEEQNCDQHAMNQMENAHNALESPSANKAILVYGKVPKDANKAS